MKKLRAALILDCLSLKMWQKAALAEASDLIDIKLILNCKNTKTKTNIRKNILYHALNAFSLKSNYTQRSKYNASNTKVLDFNSIYENSWQYIPETISKQLKDENIDVVIKFGMPFFKAGDNLGDLPVLSYHYGDPSKFSGKPAGFYELLSNEDKSGLAVQKINNKVQGNEILAFSESKLIHYSFRKSSNQFYQQSQFLLRKAIINLKAGNTLPITTDGKNYHLPSNFIVFQFFVILLSRRIKHLGYGAFFEKKWKVGTVKFEPNLKGHNLIDSSGINEFAIKPEYTFYADPFFSSDCSKVRLEALSKKTGLGDIIEIDLKRPDESKLLLTGAHYSYPFSFLLNEDEQLLPEIASHSPQYFFSLADKQKKKVTIKGLEDKRLADATLFKQDEFWYLFFGEKGSAHASLSLWFSDSITGRFKKHPSSPICTSPSSARMAGRILSDENGIFRFGQNNDRGYGAAVTISEITKLSPDIYVEEVCGSIRIKDYIGPHSIDFDKDKKTALIDYYTDEFSLLSGVRRLKAKLSKN